MKNFKKLSMLVLATLSCGALACGAAACTSNEPVSSVDPEPTVETVTDYVIDSFGTYTGTLVDGKPSGEGKLVTDSYTYEGTFEDGFRLTGEGTKTYTSGEVSEGTFVNGALNGYGKHDYNNGCIGVGYWKDGKLNGFAMFTWGPVGGPYEVYVGEWVDMSRCGQGFYTFNNGCWYKGEFADNWINGYGEFHWTGGNYWVGEFVGGSPKKGNYGYGQMDGVEGYIYVNEETGGWSWYTGTLEDGTQVENGQVKA